MRKLTIGAIVGAIFLATAAVALAVTNTVKYTASIGNAKAAKKPVNVTYSATLTVDGPGGTQPNAGSVTTLFFSKNLKNNATVFPAPCKSSDIQGATTIPVKCEKGFLGTGSATATSGTPGSAPTATIPNLQVRAYNGAKGKQILIAIKVGATWQVIPGTVKKTKGTFGYKVDFRVPSALQSSGKLAVRKLTLTLSKKKTSKKVSYVQLVSCPKSKKLPTKATVKFTDDAGNPGGGSGTSSGTMTCRR